MRIRLRVRPATSLVLAVTCVFATFGCQGPSFVTEESQASDDTANGDSPSGAGDVTQQDGSPIGDASGQGPKPHKDGFADGSPDSLSPVDTTCRSVAIRNNDIPVAPPQTPLPKSVAADCRSGVEFNNLEHSRFNFHADGLSRAAVLEIDLATYTHPDRLSLIADGLVIFDTCRLRTAKYGDPTNGHERPPEDSIRYFRVPLPLATRQLTFDWSGAESPTYFRVIGLCDFVMRPDVVRGKEPDLREVRE